MKTNMAFLLFAEFIHTYKTERMQPLHPLKTTQPSWRNLPCQVTMAIGMRTHFRNMMVRYSGNSYEFFVMMYRFRKYLKIVYFY